MMKNLLTGVSEVQADLVRVSFILFFIHMMQDRHGYMQP